MTSIELTEWGNILYKELHFNWEKWSNQCDLIKEKGYALFYSEIKMNPDLMVIGFNPGWNKDFVPLTEPKKINGFTEHEYFSEYGTYKMANKMKSIFSEELEIILRNSVKFNQLFFNSQNVHQWNREVVPVGLRYKIEQYCLNTTFEIIRNLKPKFILTEGFETFNRLIFNQDEKDFAIANHYSNAKRILLEAKLHNIPILGIPHPTGARGISGAVWDEIREILKQKILY